MTYGPLFLVLAGSWSFVAPCALLVLSAGSGPNLAPLPCIVVLCIALINLIIVPIYLDDLVPTIFKVVVIFLYGWLATFKSIGFVLHRGPLCSCTGNIAHFILVYNLPITPVWNVQNQTNTSSKTGKGRGNARQHESKEHSVIGWFLQLIGKVLLLLCVTGISARIDAYYAVASDDQHNNHGDLYYTLLPFYVQYVTELCDALALYAFIGVIMNISSCILHCLPYGMSIRRIAPHYDSPWLSHSITNFWSSRWNLNTGYTLRFVVYDPICEGRLVAPPVHQSVRIGRKRRALAMCAAFLVSGIMHEVFIYYLRSRISGYWLTYFAVQGPLILLVDEYLGLKHLGSRNIMLARFLTLSLQLFVAHHLFFPDIVRMGIPREIHGNVRSAFGLLLPESMYHHVYGYS